MKGQQCKGGKGRGRGELTRDISSKERKLPDRPLMRKLAEGF